MAVSFGLFYGIVPGALWVPHEVGFAEHSRRLAVNLLGGEGLALPGADNSLPIRADLGRGELPFTSSALGLRLLGLSAWAGRLPLTLWAVAGLLGLYSALSRLGDRKLGLYSILALATMPLYYLQARAMTGDIVTLACFALTWSGLAVACLGADVSPRARGGFALLGAVGAYAGFWCRGPIVSVAVPALAVGVTGLLHAPRAALARWLTLGVSVTGLLALVLGARGLLLAEQSGRYSALVGSSLVTPASLPTFDVGLGDLAHAAFPWSATAPLLLALLVTPGAPIAERTLVHAAALGLALGLAVSGWLAPSLGSPVLPAVSCLAVLVGAGFRALEAGRLGSPSVGFVTAGLAVVIGFDLRQHPDKVLLGFGLRGVELPEGSLASASWLWLGGACVLGVVSAFCLFERDGVGEGSPAFDTGEYLRALGALKRAYGGNLLFALLLLETGLVGFLVLCALGERLISLPQLESFGSFSRRLAVLGAIALPLAPFSVPVALLLRDLARWSFRGGSRGLTRAQGVLLAFTAVGGAASLGFYPQLAREVSPTQAFERFGSLRRPGEPLGVLGELLQAARYQGVPDATSFDETELAFDWLTEKESARRFLVLRRAELAELNAQHRALRHTNLPILDARSSEVLLASNQLRKTERSQNPLDAVVLDAPPAMQHAVDAELDERLQVLGWSLRGAGGELETSLLPARSYRLCVYFKVLATLGEQSWSVFVHIDGSQRRFNADHEPLGGKYAQHLWRPGDILVDETAIRLEPNFSPGAHRLFLGLFAGERRLPVSKGLHSDDRVQAGVVQVR